MSKNAIKYLEKEILPLIQENHPSIMSDMEIMILGSVGLGIDDDISDIEVSIYLEDEIWKTQGKQLQLLLNDCLAKTNLWKTNYPEQLWKKRLITDLKELYLEDFFELNKSIQRNHIPEANLLYGIMIERIYHMAFLVSHEYYPWRTHLDWAYRNLSISKTELSTKIDQLLSTDSWKERVEISKSIIDYYRDYIKENNLIPEIDVYSDDLEKELIWSERLSAWNTPDWRNFIKEKENNAVESGYSPDQFWVWSLWG